MQNVDSVHEMPNFAGCSGSGSDKENSVPSMPFFEVSQKNDRPFAPPAEDYPLGCEVELRDIDYAKVAQELKHWEPFLDDVFATPRRRATVKRHIGEYTFVVCTDVKGVEKVGFTLYRACLSEPKVATTKFFADVALRKENPASADVVRDEGNAADGCNTTNYTFGERDGAFPRSKFTLSRVHGSGTNGEQSGRDYVTRPDVAALPLSEQMVYWMKKGTHCMQQKRFQQALEYYNRALEAAKADTGSVSFINNQARVYSSRCVAYSYLHMPREAQEDAKRVIESLPESFIGYVRMGNLLRDVNNYADAQGFYREALAREPKNAQAKALLFSNSVSMIFEYRTKRNENLKVRFDPGIECALALAKKKIKKDEVILKETTSLITVLGACSTKPSKDCQKKSLICQYCGSVFVDPESVYKTVNSLSKSLFRALYEKQDPVRCHHSCGFVYCTDECRSKHWSESHWLECPVRGRWKNGLSKMNLYLDEYSAEFTEVDRHFIPTGSPLEDQRSVVVVACVRIVARMIFRMIGCAWPLHEAIHMYEWLCLSPSATVPLQVEAVLRKSVDLLSSEFTRQQKEFLNMDLFCLLYKRVKSNAMYITLSVWPEIRQRAETHMKLLESVSSSIEINASHTDSASANNEALRQILKLPPCGPECTYFNAIAVFDLYALTAAVNVRALPPDRRKVNAKIISTLVSNFRIRLKCTSEVQKDDVIVCAPLDSNNAP